MTGRPLTTRDCRAALARVWVGAAANPPRAHAVAFGADGQEGGGGGGAEQGGGAGGGLLAGQVEGDPAVDGAAEGDGGGGEGEAHDGVLGGVRFGAGGFQELAAGGGGVEQVGDQDARTGGAAAGVTVPTRRPRRGCGWHWLGWRGGR